MKITKWTSSYQMEENSLKDVINSILHKGKINEEFKAPGSVLFVKFFLIPIILYYENLNKS